MIDFDAKTHTYTINGVVYPSVTQIIRDAGLMGDTSWWTPEARDQGTLVHLLTAMADRRELDWDRVPESVLGYVHCWRVWVHAANAAIGEIEARVCHDGLHYAGTIDRILQLGSVTWLIDIKTGNPSPWHGVQTAAYADCIGPAQRACVYLSDTRSARFERHGNDATDRDVFRAALTPDAPGAEEALRNWKAQYLGGCDV